MPNQNSKPDALASLRAIVDAGGPMKPVRSHLSAPSAKIGVPRGGSVMPTSDEPLAQGNVLDGIFGAGALSNLADPANVGAGGASIPPIGRKPLAAFKPRQPMPSDTRMSELIVRLGGRGKSAPPSLPMDEVSRMNRAERQGFTLDAYHGTKDSFTEFHDPVKVGGYGEGDFGIHVSETPHAANLMADRAQESVNRGKWAGTDLSEINPGERGGNVLPLKVNPGRSFEVPDMGIWRDPASWVHRADNVDDALATNDPEFLRQVLREARAMTKSAPYDEMSDPATTGLLWQMRLKEMMQDAGYQSIRYPNFTEGSGEHLLLLLDPRQLRSRFAAFDPAKTNSRNLLASLAAAIGLAPMASHEPE